MGKSPERAVRTTISIPAELKARMDAVDEDVNWSAVACRAFEQRLGEIAARKQGKLMDDVITRLRASKQKFEDVRQKEGSEAGRGWAKDTAEVEELERLQTARNRDWRGWDEIFDNDDPNRAYGPGEIVVFLINPEADGDRDAASQFWEQAVGENSRDLMYDGSFVRGFAEGALNIWEEVKDRI
jgi:hypothetical protein